MNMGQETYSQQVIVRASAPKFVGSDIECSEFLKKDGHFFCHFHFPHSNGEITVYGLLSPEDLVIKEVKYFTNVEGPALAFIDVLIELSHHKNSDSLPLLRLKEIESYLRSHNSEPSFPDDGIKLIRYYELINALQNSIKKKSAFTENLDPQDVRKSPSLDEYKPSSTLLFNPTQLGTFITLDNDFQMSIVNDILAKHVRLLLQRDGGDIECVHVMENVVVVVFHGNCAQCGMSHTSTMDFIKMVLRNELNDANIHIITD